MKKVYQTRDFWINQIIEKGKTVKEICKEYGIASKTAYRWIKKLDIESIEDIDIGDDKLEDLGIDIEAEFEIQYNEIRRIAEDFKKDGNTKGELKARKIASDMIKEKLTARAKIGQKKEWEYEPTKKDIETVRRLDVVLDQLEKDADFSEDDTEHPELKETISNAWGMRPDLTGKGKPKKKKKDDEE